MLLIWTGHAGGEGEHCAMLVDILCVVVAKSVSVFLCIPVGTKIIPRGGVAGLGRSSWYEKCFLTWISQWSGVSFHEPRPFCIPMKTHSSSNRLDFQSCSSIRRLLRHRFVATVWTTRKAWIWGKNWRAHGASPLQVNNFALAIPVAGATFNVESNQALAATVGPLIEVHIFLGVIYAIKWYGSRKRWQA